LWTPRLWSFVRRPKFQRALNTVPGVPVAVEPAAPMGEPGKNAKLPAAPALSTLSVETDTLNVFIVAGPVAAAAPLNQVGVETVVFNVNWKVEALTSDIAVIGFVDVSNVTFEVPDAADVK